MRAFFLLLLFIVIPSFLFAQTRTYCDGWDDGYTKGYTYFNQSNGKIDPVFMVPMCPSGSGDYNSGYNRGFEKGQQDFRQRYGTGDQKTVIATDQKDGNYCDGWDEGYSAGYKYHNQVNGKMEPIFMVPVCPAGSGNYSDGYTRGFDRGKREFESKNNISSTDQKPVIVNRKGEGDYCDGWDAGYDAGFSYESQVAGRMKPIFIIPVCRTGTGGYQAGYSRGYEKGLEDYERKRR